MGTCVLVGSILDVISEEFRFRVIFSDLTGQLVFNVSKYQKKAEAVILSLLE